jgi:hypothetical protein
MFMECYCCCVVVAVVVVVVVVVVARLNSRRHHDGNGVRSLGGALFHKAPFILRRHPGIAPRQPQLQRSRLIVLRVAVGGVVGGDDHFNENCCCEASGWHLRMNTVKPRLTRSRKNLSVV